MLLLRFKDSRNSAERRPLPRCKGALVGAQLRGVLAAASWESLSDISGWGTCDHGMRLGELAARSCQGSRTSSGPMGLFPMGLLRGPLGRAANRNSVLICASSSWYGCSSDRWLVDARLAQGLATWHGTLGPDHRDDEGQNATFERAYLLSVPPPPPSRVPSG